MSGYEQGGIIFVGVASVFVFIGALVTWHVPAMLLGLAGMAVGGLYLAFRPHG